VLGKIDFARLEIVVSGKEEGRRISLTLSQAKYILIRLKI
jgi:hypothetical protein